MVNPSVLKEGNTIYNTGPDKFLLPCFKTVGNILTSESIPQFTFAEGLTFTEKLITPVDKIKYT